MIKNNKNIKTISKMKNAICFEKLKDGVRKNIYIIEYEDNSYNILDIKDNKDLTENWSIALDEKTRVKMIFKAS